MMEEEQNTPREPNFIKLSIITIVGLVILGVAVFLILQSSKKDKGNVTSSQNAENTDGKGKTGEQTTAKNPPTAPLRFTADINGEWNAKAGSVYPYAFSYPATLKLVVFVGDMTDKVSIDYGNIPPQQNVLFNMELIEQRDSKYIQQPKIEYVKNWYRFFSGLKGVSKIEPFTNIKGLKGYRAWYINQADATPNLDVFFEVPNRNDIIMHMANGIIDPPIFDKIIDSVRWEEAPTASPSTIRTR